MPDEACQATKPFSFLRPVQNRTVAARPSIDSHNMALYKTPWNARRSFFAALFGRGGEVKSDIVRATQRGAATTMRVTDHKEKFAARNPKSSLQLMFSGSHYVPLERQTASRGTLRNRQQAYKMNNAWMSRSEQRWLFRSDQLKLQQEVAESVGF